MKKYLISFLILVSVGVSEAQTIQPTDQYKKFIRDGNYSSSRFSLYVNPISYLSRNTLSIGGQAQVLRKLIVEASYGITQANEANPIYEFKDPFFLGQVLHKQENAQSILFNFSNGSLKNFLGIGVMFQQMRYENTEIFLFDKEEYKAKTTHYIVTGQTRLFYRLGISGTAGFGTARHTRLSDSEERSFLSLLSQLRLHIYL